MRFARKVNFMIRSGQEKELKEIFETKVIGMLQKQTGFQDELLLTHGRQATAISLWDTRTHAETYEKSGYAKVLDVIKPVIDGTPQVEACEVPYSTLHAAV